MHYKLGLTALFVTSFLGGCEPADGAAPARDYGITASNVFLYYEDVEAAANFYRDILGCRIAADYGFAKILQVAPKSFVTLVDHTKGMHSSDEPKTTAIALVTDQLDEWWTYLQTQDVRLYSEEYTPRAGSAHDGFVAIDPEGYLLEFERFNPHPENERLLPMLEQTETRFANPGSRVPAGLGFKATIVWLYYRDLPSMQRFYEGVLGLGMVADQEWAKIYVAGPTGYLGLVDERRGMHRYTEQKAVTMSFFTADIDGWFGTLSTDTRIEMRSRQIEEEDEYRAFVAYDPEGYFLEWDVFNAVPANNVLVRLIGAP